MAALEKYVILRMFNPDIANAFFRAGMIEAWGRGIEQMQADCTAQGTPWPVLRHETPPVSGWSSKIARRRKRRRN